MRKVELKEARLEGLFRERRHPQRKIGDVPGGGTRRFTGENGKKKNMTAKAGKEIKTRILTTGSAK